MILPLKQIFYPTYGPNDQAFTVSLAASIVEIVRKLMEREYRHYW
jgi:hypothetical protein